MAKPKAPVGSSSDRGYPLEEEVVSPLNPDGSRNHVHPADVAGRFTRFRKLLFAGMIAVLVALPFVRIGGHPAVFLDVPARRFYLFGATFNAQDFWLLFFVLTGLGFILIVATTLVGRVWCGYACPQTVFLEGLYRRVERLIEGPRNARLRRNQGPLTWGKAWRKTVKHLAFVGLSLVLSHVFLSYFVSLPTLSTMVRTSPLEHPEAFAWASLTAAAFYFNFAWFREQLCLIICPYGRLQSALTDADTIVVGYDTRRGEPRGKATEEQAGDCIDCKRCVVVCPTGIDIRNGLQLDCVGCAACVDACDDIMERVGRPRGLIRYDSLRAFADGKRRFFRPRLALYALLGAVGLTVATLAVRSRDPFEANLLRMAGAPYVVHDDSVRNSFEVHLVNKGSEPTTFLVKKDTGSLEYTITAPRVQLGSLESKRIAVFVSARVKEVRPNLTAEVVVYDTGTQTTRRLSAPFLGPISSD